MEVRGGGLVGGGGGGGVEGKCGEGGEPVLTSHRCFGSFSVNRTRRSSAILLIRLTCECRKQERCAGWLVHISYTHIYLDILRIRPYMPSFECFVLVVRGPGAS